jgi:hypothetical protein
MAPLPPHKMIDICIDIPIYLRRNGPCCSGSFLVFVSNPPFLGRTLEGKNEEKEILNTGRGEFSPSLHFRQFGLNTKTRYPEIHITNKSNQQSRLTQTLSYAK